MDFNVCHIFVVILFVYLSCAILCSPLPENEETTTVLNVNEIAEEIEFCIKDQTAEGRGVKEFARAVHGNWSRLAAKREGKLLSELDQKNEKIEELKDDLAVNAVRFQIEFLELMFEVHSKAKLDFMSSSQTPKLQEPQTQSAPKPSQSVIRANKRVTADEHAKIWQEFFRECTHPQFLEIKQKVVKPIPEEPEEKRFEREEERINTFLSGISATFAYSSGDIHAIKGGYTPERIKSALKKKGVEMKPIYNVVDLLYLINVP